MGVVNASTPAAPSRGAGAVVRTDVPARLDALPWGRFHTLVVVALGVTWVLDGLEVTLAGAVASAVRESPALHMTALEIGVSSSAYLAGAVLGALGFGWLTDRWGRRRLFFVTLTVYMFASAATGLAWDAWSFACFRFLTGAGIGGEYTAINSTIQELIPARVRGWSDLVINGSFWIGAALGAGGSLVLLDPALFDADTGWRLCFLIGAGLAVPILWMRRWIPESPRWLIAHGGEHEASSIVAAIEDSLRAAGAKLASAPHATIEMRARGSVRMGEVVQLLLGQYRRRALVGLSLMAAQAFFYNAIFFTYALVLTDFYDVASSEVGRYILPFALGNVLGPVILGRFFDTIGRRPMIAATYIVSAVLLLASGWLFRQGMLDGATQTLAWTVTFFFASAAASSAYLTVSETFPLEVRALAIAFFYAIGTGLGGAAGPWLFGMLIDTGSRTSVLGGYLFGAVLMVVAALIALRWGVAAERKPLEAVAVPLSFAD